jgi:hypothetical protein
MELLYDIWEKCDLWKTLEKIGKLIIIKNLKIYFQI